MSSDIDRIGEVIESSTTEFAAESRRLHEPPPFGCFVKVPMNDAGLPAPTTAAAQSGTDDSRGFRDMAGRFNEEYDRAVIGNGHLDPFVRPAEQSMIYAVVYNATTGPTDPGRKPRAYWKDEDVLQEEQPEISEWLLLTHFRAIIIGYSQGGRIYQILPPRPPRIHSHASLCTPDEVQSITARLDFLRTLTGAMNAPTEEVIAACIREANSARGDSFDFLVDAGKELAGLLKDDYDRLNAIMRRVVP